MTVKPATAASDRRSTLMLAAGAGTLGLAAGMFTLTRGLRIVSPPALVRLSTQAPSRHGEVFPARTVPASSAPRPAAFAPRPLPGTVPWPGGPLSVGSFLSRTHTNALLVRKDGVLVHEWYREGFGSESRLPSWSVAKSIVSLLVGQAVARGELSEQDRLVELLPELRRGSAYDEITVAHLLDMASGIDVSENYNPWLPLRGAARLLLTTDLARFVQTRRELRFAPGSRAEYRSVDTQLLGQILSRATGKPLSTLLSQRLWEPIGAESPATWNTDRTGGIEKAFCGVNATARDFAKIGQLVLDDGRVEGTQVVPAAWIARIRTPAPHRIDGWGYSAQWWLPADGDSEDLSALGVYGQYVYVDPPTRTVIVKLSDHGAEQDETETIEAMRAIARHL